MQEIYSVTVHANSNNLLKTGYMFSGWSDSSNGSVFPNQSFVLTDDITFYAKWTPNTHNISYNLNGGTGSVPATITGDYNTSVTLSDEGFTQTGYSFAGWNTLGNGTGISYGPGQTILVTANITLYAIWTTSLTAITKLRIKTLISNNVSPFEVRLTPSDMVGFKLKPSVERIIAVQGSYYLSASALVNTAYYTLLDVSGDTLTIPLSSFEVIDGVFLDPLVRSQVNSSNTLISFPNLSIEEFQAPEQNNTITILNNGTNYTITLNGETSYWEIGQTFTIQNSNTIISILIGSALVQTSVLTLSPIICFRKGSRILCLNEDTCDEEYRKIETITPGTYVKTYLHGYVPVHTIGYRTIDNPGHNDRIANRLYKLSPSQYYELKDDLYLTGCHSVLVHRLTEKQDEMTRNNHSHRSIYKTDGKYRLMTQFDERAIPYDVEGEYEVWHLALDHNDIKMNYGIYANGLLVESCCQFKMENREMKLIR